MRRRSNVVHLKATIYVQQSFTSLFRKWQKLNQAQATRGDSSLVMPFGAEIGSHVLFLVASG